MNTKNLRSAALIAASLFAVAVIAASSTPVAAGSQEETATEKNPLTLADYPHWSRINSVALSPDGAWMSYSYAPNEGDSTLFVRALDGDRVFEATNGSGPQFSDDSGWVGFITTPPEEESGGGRRGGRGGGGRGGRGSQAPGGDDAPPTRALKLIELATGEEQEIADARAFEFSKGSSFMAIHKNRADRAAEHEGADLVLRNLDTGMDLNIGSVSQFAFNDGASMLAYIVDAANMSGNGLYVLDLAGSRIMPLDTTANRYARLSWSEDGTSLAVLRGDSEEGFEQRENALVAFLDVAPDGTATRVEYDPASAGDFPEGFVLSELGSVDWSADGSRVFVGIKQQRPELEEGDDPQANVDVWHWKDERVQSVQIVRANADRNFTYRSVLLLEPTRFVRLADDQMRTVTPTEDGLYAIGRDDSEFRGDMSIAGGLSDFYLIDTGSGDKQLIADDIRYSLGTSPDSQWFLYQEDGEVKARHLGDGTISSLSATAGVDFVNQEFDRPTEKSTYGLAGWTTDGSSVVLNHRFDLWVVPLRPNDGSRASGNGSTGTLPTGGGVAASAAPDGAYTLTRGVGDREQIRFRYVDLEATGGARGRGGFGGGGRAPTEIDLDEEIILSAYGERTKKSGYWRYDAASSEQPFGELIWEDRMIGGLRKAEDADRYLLTRQTIVEFPDYWLMEDDGGGLRKITDANPQQSEYAWTPGRVLIDYTDRRGHELQATLTLPAGYEAGRRYPMVVYFYEKMSQRHHEYSQPVYDDRPHMSTYASNGYLVLMPDIIYDDGRPGTSALDDVTSAVQQVIDLGYADPDRIGLQGHSWGGYESSFIVTQTDMFAAVVTGAPLTNLVSMHNILYKSSGGPNAPLIQFGQGRMAASPWDDFEAYVRESPVHNAEGITTPFLILHGTEDGAVDWNQGLEFYIAAKRLGKEVILLSYPEEPHHLAKEENQKDFQIRMMQYFDHHLKGAEAPPWLSEGVPFLDKGRAPVEWQ